MFYKDMDRNLYLYKTMEYKNIYAMIININYIQLCNAIPHPSNNIEVEAWMSNYNIHKTMGCDL